MIFFATNSYYAEVMDTVFEKCEISGSYDTSFLTAETINGSVDGVTNTNSNDEFRNALKVIFKECKIDVNTPTLATTHAPNFSFWQCKMKLYKKIIDLRYVSNRLVNIYLLFSQYSPMLYAS